MPDGTHGTKPADLASQRAKELRAVELAIAGRNYTQIAEEIGYADRAGAHKAVHRALGRQEAAAVGELRELEGARLDALQHAHWDQAVSGSNLKAAEFVRKVIEQRARLFGLVLQPQTERVPDLPADPIEQLAMISDLTQRIRDREAQTGT